MAQKILANCCKMQKRCYLAGRLVNWSEGEDKEKIVGYAVWNRQTAKYQSTCKPDLFCYSDPTDSKLYTCNQKPCFMLHHQMKSTIGQNVQNDIGNSESKFEHYAEMPANTILLLSLKPWNTSSYIPRDVLTWNIYFHCRYKFYILTFKFQH